jgi:hypothetical protein
MGATVIAAAQLCRNFLTRLGRGGHEGVHQLFSLRQSAFCSVNVKRAIIMFFICICRAMVVLSLQHSYNILVLLISNLITISSNADEHSLLLIMQTHDRMGQLGMPRIHPWLNQHICEHVLTSTMLDLNITTLRLLSTKVTPHVLCLLRPIGMMLLLRAMKRWWSSWMVTA